MREQLVQYINLLFAETESAEEIREEIMQNSLDRYDDLIRMGSSPESAYQKTIAGIGNLEEILGSVRKEDAYPPQAPIQEQNFSKIPISQVMRAIAVGLYIICLIPTIALDAVNLGSIGFMGTLLIVAAATMLMIYFPKKKSAEAAAAEPAFTAPEPAVIRLLHTAAIGMYILSLTPLILLDTIGWSDLGVCITLLIVACATVLLMVFRKGKSAGEASPEPMQKRFPEPNETANSFKKNLDKLISQIGLVLYFVISFTTGAWGITWVIFLLIPAVRGLVNALIDLKGM